MLFFKMLLGLLLVFTAVCLSTARNTEHEIQKRLPRNFIPHHYSVTFEPDMTLQPPFNVKSEITIHVVCHIETSLVVLNYFGPTFSKKDVSIFSGQEITVPTIQSVSYYTGKQFVYLSTDQNFLKGFEYQIVIKYTSVANKDRFGMFYAPYINSMGETEYLIATQLEPIGARLIMPCFDEVDLKATFNVSIIRRRDQFAISNTHIVSSASIGDKAMDTFATTPKMTPYLFAMVVGDLKFLKSSVDNQTKYEIQTVSTENLLPYIEHPNQYYTAPLQLWLENVTKIPYELKKMDHIALSNFGGAMENWGLITYAENILPVNIETSNTEGILRCSSIIAHELAHMWYGNLVTCSWWTHLWIQEGLASYYNFQPLFALGWDADSLQQSETIQIHLITDQTNMTTPVRIQIDSPQAAITSFSKSTYDKGAALFRMAEAILSRPNLEKAFNKFLVKFRYKPANSNDMLAALTQQAAASSIVNPDGSPIDFKVILDPWLDQKGYPLVKVVTDNSGKATITQFRYLSPRNQMESEPSEYGYKWDVPISLVDAYTKPPATPKGPDYWLKINDNKLEIDIKSESGYWFLINQDQMYFYRVWYDEKTRKAISENLLKVSAASRAQIIDDSFSLARNAYYTVETALDNTWALRKEGYQPSWAATLRHLGEIEAFFRAEKWYSRFRTHFMNMARDVIQQIGEDFKPVEPIELHMLRKDLLALMVSFGDKKYKEAALQKYLVYVINPSANPVNANILPVVLCAGVNEMDEKYYYTVKSEYTTRRLTPIREERTSIAFALTCSPRQKDLMFIFDDLALHGKFFEEADVSTTAGYLAATPFGEKHFMSYLDKNWDQKIRFNKLHVITKITNKWYTTEKLTELKEFIGRRRDLSKAEEHFFSQRVLQVEQNVHFYKDNVHVFADWFDKHYGQIMVPSESLKNLAPSHLSSFTMFGEARMSNRDDFLMAKYHRGQRDMNVFNKK